MNNSNNHEHQQGGGGSGSRIGIKLVLASAAVIVLALSVGFGLGFSNDGGGSPKNNSTITTSKKDSAPTPSSNKLYPTTASSTSGAGDVNGVQSPSLRSPSFPTESPATTQWTPNPTLASSEEYTNWETTSAPITVDEGDETVEEENNVGISFASRFAMVSPQSIRESYSSCDALRVDLKDEARIVGKYYIDYYADSYYGYYGDDYYQTSSVSTRASSGTAKIPDNNATNSTIDSQTKSTVIDTASDSYGTNNQHAGIEEADFVQSNGVQVFAVYGSVILVVNVDSMTVTSRTEVPDVEYNSNCYGSIVRGMLLVEDGLVVFTERSCSIYWSNETSSTSTFGSASSSSSSSSSTYVGQQTNTTILIYDGASMTLRTTRAIPGVFVSARAIGDNVHVVTSAILDRTILSVAVDPYRLGGLTTTILNEDSYRKLAEEQLELCLDTYVEMVISNVDCTGFQKIALWQNTNVTSSATYASTYYASTYLASISSFAVSATSFSLNSTSMMLPNGYWYVTASAEYMVLACQTYSYDEYGSYDDAETYVIGLRLDGASSTPVALGAVAGTVLGPYSIDLTSKNGTNYVRVAHTNYDQTESFVTVLQMTENSDAMMPIVGKLSGLGNDGERIYSVRFIGDRAFMVTFVQIDPFYTIDLSDPTNPQVIGELSIPGYSTYLHPIGDDLILGVGRNTSEFGSVLNLKLSMFNVSDFGNPIRLHFWEDNATMSVSSKVEYDTKAFRYLDDVQMLILPITNSSYVPIPCDYEVQSDDMYDCSTYETFEGFVLFKLNATTGISKYLSIDHGYMYSSCNKGELPPRSLVMDGEVLTMIGQSIRSHDLTTKEETSIPIYLNESCSYSYNDDYYN